MRPADLDFDPDESLYRRIHPNYRTADGSINAGYLKLPTMSVNRGRYSEPEDVVRNHPGQGIATFPVRAIPSSLRDPRESILYEFRVEHVPEVDNYSHSEVRTYVSDERSTAEPPAMIKKLFREAIRRNGLKVLVEPVASET
jgi:hypothetical protein